MCQIWYAVKRCSLHALPVTELALHLPDIDAFSSGAHAAACRKILAACGIAVMFPLPRNRSLKTR